jgi:neutral ceramidase
MLNCGAAKATITPPEWPVYLSGYGARLSNACHDDVWVTALYLEQGDEKFVVLTYDMISNSEEFIEEVQKACSEVTGLPERKHMLTASHVHSTPSIQAGGRSSETFSQAFRDRVLAASVEATREAVENAESVTVQYNTTHIRENLNRRVFFPDGQYYYQPKQKHLKAIGTGHVDDELGVIFFKCVERDAYKAILVNYTAHPLTVGDTSKLVTADYPGVLKREIEDSLGGVAMFINGACGDNHPLGAEAGFGRCERMGSALAEAAMYHRWDAVPLENPSIACDYRKLILPALTEEEWQRLPQNFASRHRQTPEEKQEDGGIRTWICLWSLGPILFVGLPGEVSAELGQRLKWESPFPKAFMMYISTDYLGYISHRNAYTWGGYEVLTSRLGPHGGGQIISEAIDAAEEMRSKLLAAGADLSLPGQETGAVPQNKPGTAG